MYRYRGNVSENLLYVFSMIILLLLRETLTLNVEFFEQIFSGVLVLLQL